MAFGRLGALGRGFGKLGGGVKAAGSSEPFPGFDFYVDQVAGNDANAGTSSALAKKTISAAYGLMSANKKLGLAKGSTWREQLSVTHNGVTIGSYGTGDQPVLTASNVIAAGSFAVDGVGAPAYNFSVTPTTAGGAASFSVFEYGGQVGYLVNGANHTDCMAIKEEGIDSLYVTFQSAAGTGCTHTRCFALGGRAFGETAAFKTESGFYSHASSGTWTAQTYTGCEIWNCNGGWDGDVTTMNLSGCRSKDVASPIHMTGGSGRVWNVTTSFFDGRGTAAFQNAVNFIQNNQGTLNFNGNVIILNPTGYQFAIRNISENGSVINASKNTIANQNAAQGQAVFYKNGTGLVTLDRNIFYEFGDAILQDDADATFAATNDNWRKASGNIAFSNGGVSYANFGLWQAAGQDVTGTSVDPTFTNALSTWEVIADAAISSSTVNALLAGATNYP